MVELGKCLSAEAIALTRAASATGGERASYIHDKARNRPRDLRLEHSFADAVMGPYLHQAQPGTVWFKSLMDIDHDPQLEGFHHARSLNELALIALAAEAKSTMLLELHFQDHEGSGLRALVTMCAPTLADTWSRRKPGFLTEVLLNRKPQNSEVEPTAELLSDANPARLSRAAFRVCLLLSRGLSLKGVRDQLGICESTLRTHLRSFYAKTNTDSQTALVYRLLSTTDRMTGRDLLGVA